MLNETITEIGDYKGKYNLGLSGAPLYEQMGVPKSIETDMLQQCLWNAHNLHLAELLSPEELDNVLNRLAIGLDDYVEWKNGKKLEKI